MAGNYLETNKVNHNFETYSYENVSKELEKTSNSDELSLLKKYPDTFPFLYAVRSRHLDDDAQFSFEEVEPVQKDIVPESHDVMPRDKELQLNCDLKDAGAFSIKAEPFDQAGEDQVQLKARIDFPDKTLKELNMARLTRILEFCEKHGLSVWQISVPYKDGKIDVDEKLATLTDEFLKGRQQENAENPGPTADCDDQSRYQNLEVLEKDVSSADKASTKAKPKKPKTIDDVRADIVDLLEKDLHRTRKLSYFEHKKLMNGRKTYEFSIYDRPDQNHEKEDGRQDKDGHPKATYQYRLYAAQDSKTGEFYFGFATPGGKKIDDAMAGDLIGIIKKTGATHINFANIHNLEKGVWLTACAEKGIIPIGISINVPKAKNMVEAAKKKLTDEEFVIFKRNLAEQMIENAAAKAKNKSDKTLGLSPSEWGYIESLRSAYNFENFRQAYEDENGLYAAVIDQINKGSRDKKEGAATTFGGMQTLRTVFDIYQQNQNKTFGDYLNNPPLVGNMALTSEERQKLSTIPATKPMTQLSTADFMLIYNTLLPRHIEDSKKQIVQALEREDARKGPKRASNAVLTSDLFPKVKVDLDEINRVVTRNMGLEALTLPNVHKGLEYMRVDADKAPAANSKPAQEKPAEKKPLEPSIAQINAEQKSR